MELRLEVRCRLVEINSIAWGSTEQELGLWVAGLELRPAGMELELRPTELKSVLRWKPAELSLVAKPAKLNLATRPAMPQRENPGSCLL